MHKRYYHFRESSCPFTWQQQNLIQEITSMKWDLIVGSWYLLLFYKCRSAYFHEQKTLILWHSSLSNTIFVQCFAEDTQLCQLPSDQSRRLCWQLLTIASFRMENIIYLSISTCIPRWYLPDMLHFNGSKFPVNTIMSNTKLEFWML